MKYVLLCVRILILLRVHALIEFCIIRPRDWLSYHCVPMSHLSAHGQILIKMKAIYATVSTEVQPVNCAFLAVLAIATLDRATDFVSKQLQTHAHYQLAGVGGLPAC